MDLELASLLMLFTIWVLDIIIFKVHKTLIAFTVWKKKTFCIGVSCIVQGIVLKWRDAFYIYSHIILMVADDMTCNPRNPRPGMQISYLQVFDGWLSPCIKLHWQGRLLWILYGYPCKQVWCWPKMAIHLTDKVLRGALWEVKAETCKLTTLVH